MIQQRGLVHGAGVVVKTAGDGEIHGEVFLRHAEVRQILHHGVQLRKPLVKQLVSPTVARQRRQHVAVGAGDSDKLQNFRRLLLCNATVGEQQRLHLFRADLVQLVHGAHDGAGLLRQPQHGVKPVQNFPVVHPNLEPLQPQTGEGLINNGRDLRLVGDVQLAVADDVDVRLIKLAEPSPLRPLAPIDLADLVAAEGEAQLTAVERHILGQRHRQVKAQRQIGVALLKAIDLLFGLAAALGQQHLAGLDDRRIQRREAVEGVGLPQDLHHPLHLLLRLGQQLHKAREGAGRHFCHVRILLLR